jgi:hypothetical protein
MENTSGAGAFILVEDPGAQTPAGRSYRRLCLQTAEPQITVGLLAPQITVKCDQKSQAESERVEGIGLGQ